MTRELVYLGWQGNINFGDDLLHETWKAALDDPLDVEAPLHAPAYLKRAPSFAWRRIRSPRTERLVLLGGGTTIGFGTWAGHVARAGFAYRASAVVGLGLGAAESTDAHLLRTQPHDWPAWRRDRRFRLAGVRGPISRAEVERHLGGTEVVGDPALLYPVVRPVEPYGVPAIGVALGSDPTTRFDIGMVARVLDRHAAAGGLPIRVFALARADRATARRLASLLVGPHEVHDYDGDVHAGMRAIAACRILVSERLHGVIAAAALGVPTVPLAYASKCDDFWLSVTGVRPTTSVDVTELELDAAMDAVAAQSDDIARAVRNMQQRLAVLAERISTWRHGGDLDVTALSCADTDTDTDTDTEEFVR